VDTTTNGTNEHNNYSPTTTNGESMSESREKHKLQGQEETALDSDTAAAEPESTSTTTTVRPTNASGTRCRSNEKVRTPSVEPRANNVVVAASVDPPKVKIHFVAVGSAPILKRTKFQMEAHQRFGAVHVFLRKLLKLSPTSSSFGSQQRDQNDVGEHRDGSSSNLFLYCHSAFVPSPDHLMGELRDSFAVRDELVIHYSLQEAWG
jgi:ubiquitin-like protein ATG12